LKQVVRGNVLQIIPPAFPAETKSVSRQKRFVPVRKPMTHASKHALPNSIQPFNKLVWKVHILNGKPLASRLF
jgi:hypothetical protein